MDEEEKRKVLDLYPEFERIYGPYIRQSDSRKIVLLYGERSRIRTTRQLAKVRLEVSLGRRLIDDETVDHKDEDKTNDDIDNLQVLNLKNNVSKSSTGNSYGLGYKQTEEQKRNGYKNGLSKFAKDDATNIRTWFKDGSFSKEELITFTGLSRRTLENVLSNRSHVDKDYIPPVSKPGRKSVD